MRSLEEIKSEQKKAGGTDDEKTRVAGERALEKVFAIGVNERLEVRKIAKVEIDEASGRVPRPNMVLDNPHGEGEGSVRMLFGQKIKTVSGDCVHGLAVDIGLLHLGAIAADCQHGLTNPGKINDYAATDPNMVGVARHVVAGIRQPAGGIDVGRGPCGIVAQAVDALVIRDARDLRIENARG